MHTYDRNYFKIALPAALEGLFMILLASTDLIMVGALGALSIAAVSIFMQPRLILLCFSRSRHGVSKKPDERQGIFHRAFLLERPFAIPFP